MLKYLEVVKIFKNIHSDLQMLKQSLKLRLLAQPFRL